MTPLSTFSKFIFLLLLFLVSTGKLVAWGNDSLVPEGQNSLQMLGRVLKSQGQERNDEKVPLDSAQIGVISEQGKVLWTGLTDNKGRLNIKLPLGRKFTLSFTKKGYVKKIICVDTHVSSDSKKKDYDFTYDIDIFESIAGLDVSVLSEPVAKISYKLFDKTFSYDVVYTTKVNSGLQKMYREYYNLKRKEDAAKSDSVPVPNTPVKQQSGIKKSVPYGQDKKPHQEIN